MNNGVLRTLVYRQGGGWIWNHAGHLKELPYWLRSRAQVRAYIYGYIRENWEGCEDRIIRITWA